MCVGAAAGQDQADGQLAAAIVSRIEERGNAPRFIGCGVMNSLSALDPDTVRDLTSLLNGLPKLQR